MVEKRENQGSAEKKNKEAKPEIINDDNLETLEQEILKIDKELESEGGYYFRKGPGSPS